MDNCELIRGNLGDDFENPNLRIPKCMNTHFLIDSKGKYMGERRCEKC